VLDKELGEQTANTLDSGRFFSEEKPLVSICMPHLNSVPFTNERMDTIISQTLRDWELIVVDSDSDDGSRQILERYGSADRRIRIVTGPRDGIYTNLNRAIDRASGKYVYIATSDDTMAADCLEKMVQVLEKNPECAVCHCSLQIIDDRGQPVSDADDWAQYSRQTECFGDWINTPHIRMAPHDGILHFSLGTVYTSLTQLLVRRQVFDDIGLFRTDCSPHADFEWGMRLGLTENVVHLPERLATWRCHKAQATQEKHQLRVRAGGEFYRLTGLALAAHKKRDPDLVKALTRSRLKDFYLVDEFMVRRMTAKSLGSWFWYAAVFIMKHPVFSARWFFRKVIRRQKMTPDFADALRDEFRTLGMHNLLRPLQLDSLPCSSLAVAK
jgi:glycosyltransferase involved in cell wall biosynthesis